MALKGGIFYFFIVLFTLGFHSANAKVYSAVSCEGHTLKLSCWIGNMIQVLEADYGRWSATVCEYFEDPNMNLTCHSRHAETIVKARCNGRRSCSMKANNENFLDPCPGQVKYAEAKYICVTNAVPQARPHAPHYHRQHVGSSSSAGDELIDKSVQAIANAIKNYPQKHVTESSKYIYNNDNNNHKNKTKTSHNKQTITYGYNGDWNNSNTKLNDWWNPDYNVNAVPEDNNKQTYDRPIGWNFNSSVF